MRDVVRRALALGIVYPVLAWWALLGLLMVIGLGLTVAATLAASATVGLRWLYKAGGSSGAILDRLELNHLVKSYRLRRRVRRWWRPAMHEAKLTTSTLHGARRVLAVPHRGPVYTTPLGVSVTVGLSGTAATVDELRTKLPKLESKFGATGSRAVQVAPGLARLDLRHTDPLARRVSVSEFVGLKFTAPAVPVGIDEDGWAVVKSAVLPTMIVGAQGAGKSTEVWTIIRGLLIAGISVRLRIFDPKAQEFPELADVVHEYCRSPLGWPGFLGNALDGLSERQRRLAARGVRNLPDATRGRFSDADPLDLMVVDELLALKAAKSKDVSWTDVDRSKQTAKAGDALTILLSQGRAAGHSMVGLSQLGQKAVLGPEVVDLFPNKTLLRCASDEQVRMVLDADPAAYPAHRIPFGLPGVGYLDTRSPRGIIRYRSAETSPAERRWIVGQLRAMKARQESARPAAA